MIYFRIYVMNKSAMKTKVISIFTLILLTVCYSCDNADQRGSDFGAYYTTIKTGSLFDKYSRIGEYTDIVVDLGADFGQLVFWHGANFRPYWKGAKADSAYLQEIIPRSGDGKLPLMPDRVNTYSHAKIIESTDKHVIVHWRYLKSFEEGNPHQHVSASGFVDEYFSVTAGGEIHRTIREGRVKSDDWNDRGNILCQTILLEPGGFRSSDLDHDYARVEQEAVNGASLIEADKIKPIFLIDFNEGIGDFSQEKISQNAIEITGRKALWRKGVSGTCLQFDGYNTEIRLKTEESLHIDKELTLQAFVALGAYPWSWCPIIQQCDDDPEEITSKRENGKYVVNIDPEDEAGFFLGIDGDGHPGLKLRVNGKWLELVADFHLERRTWYLLTATFNGATGEMKVFVDNQEVGSKTVKTGSIELSDQDILVGRGKPRRPINPVRANTFPGQFAFDGLIDEVKIYNVQFTNQQIEEYLSAARKNMEEPVNMDQRVLPAGKDMFGFGAYYDHLNFYDIWDNLWCFSDHPDIVVGFEDNPSKFVFWRGVSYIPMMVNEKGQWFSNEFNETWGTSGGDGCQEPMSDKGNYFTYARILENTPARVVVHYRFPLADVNLVKANYEEETGWYDVADWYYYIYPDGVASKKMHLWTSGERNHEWQESMAIFGPDQHPEDIIEKENTVTMMNMDGEMARYNWTTAPPPNVSKPEDQCIQIVNYTGEYDPVTIGEDFEYSNVYGGELTPYSVFPTWNHWPVAQMPSDGRYASYPDRTGHSSLTHVYLPIYDESFGDKPFYEKLLLEGMLDVDKIDLVTLTKSWNHAPAIEMLSEGRAVYDKAQRAYILDGITVPVKFVIHASADQPMYNCSLVVRKWGQKMPEKLLMDGEEVKAKFGIVRDTDASYKLIIWFETIARKDFEVEIIP